RRAASCWLAVRLLERSGSLWIARDGAAGGASSGGRVAVPGGAAAGAAVGAAGVMGAAVVCVAPGGASVFPGRPIVTPGRPVPAIILLGAGGGACSGFPLSSRITLGRGAAGAAVGTTTPLASATSVPPSRIAVLVWATASTPPTIACNASWPGYVGGA